MLRLFLPSERSGSGGSSVPFPPRFGVPSGSNNQQPGFDAIPRTTATTTTTSTTSRTTTTTAVVPTFRPFSVSTATIPPTTFPSFNFNRYRLSLPLYASLPYILSFFHSFHFLSSISFFYYCVRSFRCILLSIFLLYILFFFPSSSLPNKKKYIISTLAPFFHLLSLSFPICYSFLLSLSLSLSFTGLSVFYHLSFKGTVSKEEMSHLQPRSKRLEPNLGPPIFTMVYFIASILTRFPMSMSNR